MLISEGSYNARPEQKQDVQCKSKIRLPLPDPGRSLPVVFNEVSFDLVCQLRTAIPSEQVEQKFGGIWCCILLHSIRVMKSLST